MNKYFIQGFAKVADKHKDNHTLRNILLGLGGAGALGAGAYALHNGSTPEADPSAMDKLNLNPNIPMYQFNPQTNQIELAK